MLKRTKGLCLKRSEDQTQNSCGAGPEVIKLFYMLNSAEYEIFSANEYENANNSWHFHIYLQNIFHAQLCLARKS